MKAFIQEFKNFISRGNVIDMAVGIIVGASFGKIVDSLVKHVIMPPIGFILGGVDFSDLKITIKQATDSKSAVTIDYGIFFNAVIDFVIISFAIFALIKVINTLHRKKEKATNKTCPECQMTVPVKARKCGHCTSALEDHQP